MGPSPRDFLRDWGTDIKLLAWRLAHGDRSEMLAAVTIVPRSMIFIKCVSLKSKINK